MKATISSVDRRARSRKNRRCFQDLVRSAQVADLFAKLGELGPLRGRHPGASTAVDLCPLQPCAQRLIADAELTSDSSDHAVVAGVLASKLEDHADRTFFQLIRIPLLGPVKPFSIALRTTCQHVTSTP
jgi:hypothetical protein